MTNEIVRVPTPEDLELIKKKAELIALETTLGESELRLTTLHAELAAFEGRYMRIVGVRLAELDDIQAQIAEALAKQNPSDPDAKKQATEARTQANESANDSREAKGAKRMERFVASDRLKRLYRELARRVHPDLVTDEEARRKRNALMARVNQAYADGDEEALEAILREWETSPDSVQGDGLGADLVRVIRKIAQVKSRLRQIDEQIQQLMGSDLYRMKIQAEEAEGEHRDILLEMADKVEEQIAAAKKRLGDILLAH